MGLHIIITGNPVNGFRYFGPFATHDEAADQADRQCLQEYWISVLEHGDQAEG